MTASASAVSRILTLAGFEKSRWLRSGRVRGWGSTTTGFEAEVITEYDKAADATFPTGVRVRWVLGDWVVDRSLAVGKANAEIARAGETLTRKGYTVERRTNSATGIDFLHVTKENRS